MKTYLEQVRTPVHNTPLLKQVTNSIIIFLLGIGLGIFSKWLDNSVLDQTVWLQKIFDTLDLRNVFSSLGIWIVLAICISIFSNTPWRAGINVFLFFLGMCLSYHIYTIVFAGFNPQNYMLIWYAITLISPLMAFICWYGKGNGIIGFIIRVWITTVMLLLSFSIGLWYFYFISLLDTLFFFIILALIYDTPKKTMYCCFCSIILAYIIIIFY